MRVYSTILATFLSIPLVAGCGNQISLEGDGLAALFANAVGIVQSRPQQLPPVLIDRGDTVSVSASATIIVNPSTDFVYDELPNVTVLVFENDTDWDIHIRYYADGELQGVYVYQGEALLIEYPCLDVIELDTEDDIDPFTGELVDFFDLSGLNYFNPDDFFCGDAFILNFSPFAVTERAVVLN